VPINENIQNVTDNGDGTCLKNDSTFEYKISTHFMGIKLLAMGILQEVPSQLVGG